MKVTQNVIRKFAGRSVGLAVTLCFGLLSGLAVAADGGLTGTDTVDIMVSKAGRK